MINDKDIEQIALAVKGEDQFLDPLEQDLIGEVDESVNSIPLLILPEDPDPNPCDCGECWNCIIDELSDSQDMTNLDDIDNEFDPNDYEDDGHGPDDSDFEEI